MSTMWYVILEIFYYYYHHNESSFREFEPLLIINSFVVVTGRRSFHIQKSTCSSCGYPSAKIRKCTFTFYSFLGMGAANSQIRSGSGESGQRTAPHWLEFAFLERYEEFKSTMTLISLSTKFQTIGAKRQSEERQPAPGECDI